MWEEISEIIPNRLYLSGYKGARDVRKILRLKIDTIVSITDFIPFKYDKPDQFSNINFIHYHAEDAENFNIKQYFNVFCELINDNPEKVVLVHCLVGVSRSPSLIIAYLLKTSNNLKNYTVDDALNYVITKRDFIKPNDGFIGQLKEFRNELLNIT